MNHRRRAALHVALVIAIMALTFAGLFVVFLPACQTEDSSNCAWDAAIHGNGEGRSFIDIAGQAIYLP